MLPCRNSSVSWSIFTWVITDVTFLPWTQTNSLGARGVAVKDELPFKSQLSSSLLNHITVSPADPIADLHPSEHSSKLSACPQLCSALAELLFGEHHWLLTPVASVTQSESRTLLSSRVSPLHRARRESSILKRTTKIHSSIMHWLQSRSAFSCCKQITK